MFKRKNAFFWILIFSFIFCLFSFGCDKLIKDLEDEAEEEVTGVTRDFVIGTWTLASMKLDGVTDTILSRTMKLNSNGSGSHDDVYDWHDGDPPVESSEDFTWSLSGGNLVKVFSYGTSTQAATKAGTMLTLKWTNGLDQAVEEVYRK
ncbi:lipocalin family protein [candidate division KSB1 bacterium]